MPCDYCCDKYENGDFIEPPCCKRDKCTAAKTDATISQCICCGAEMIKENGWWYHWSQMSIPINERQTQYSE